MTPVCHQAAAPKRNPSTARLGLHDEAALIGGLPLGQEPPVVETEPSGLFGEIDVEGGACEQSRDRESKVA